MRAAKVARVVSLRELNNMTDFFPPPNYPGIFSTREWIDAWQGAWGDSGNIVQVSPFVNTNIPRKNLYLYQQQKIPLLTFSTLFPAGISTRASRSLRSEYFMLGEMEAEEFIFLAYGYNWDQLYIPDIITNSIEYSQLVDAAERKGLRVLVRDTATSYAVRLYQNNFSDYLKKIGSNTRLKLYNKRKKLHQLGNITTLNIWPRVDEFIEILNEFHMRRWGKPCFEGRNLQQITDFLHQISLVGGVPDLSVIYCDDKPISVVMDIYYRQRIYNIQSGYIEKFQDGISLGTLHLGMQLEKAFLSDAYFYDFMVGNGKNSNYKQSLSTDSEELSSIMLVRNPLLKSLYCLNDIWSRFKSPAN